MKPFGADLFVQLKEFHLNRQRLWLALYSTVNTFENKLLRRILSSALTLNDGLVVSPVITHFILKFIKEYSSYTCELVF